MPSGRRQVSYEGLRYDAITKKIDNATITFDATKTNGSAGVGLAVTIVPGTVDAVALAADGDRILGKLLKVESDGFCTVQDSGFMSLPAGASATVTPGQRIVGALGPSSAKGYIRDVVAVGSSFNQTQLAEAVKAQGLIHNAEDTTKVWVDLG
jgi:hypothetical protein